ncbi:amidase [Nocardioidaceae bacterium]|nr:amidase [Nocardioidaceae bacterium]
MPEQSVLARLESRLAAIAAHDRRLRALVHLDQDEARRAAAALDRVAERDRGPLHGVVTVVKDNIDVAGQVTGCCSPARGSAPAGEDAPVVARLRRAGALVLARANMDELAMGASTATSVHGATRNPHDHTRSPGGSSGGCAAAVAAGFADLAIGTDTGGSIREPASQCGIWGLAPSPALVPTGGVVPFAPSCDRVGPMALDPALLTRAWDVMAGSASAASDPAPAPTPARIGLVTELAGEPNRPGVRAALATTVASLRRTGVEVVEVSLPDAPGALAAYMTLTSVECLPHLRPWLATGRAGTEVVRRTRLATALLRDDLDRVADAQALRERLAHQCAVALGKCDALLSPTMPTTAPGFAPAGPPTVDVADPLTAPYTDCWTVVANLAGLPSLSVPVGRSEDDGMPVGMMLTGRRGDDRRLVDLGRRLGGAV